MTESSLQEDLIRSTPNNTKNNTIKPFGKGIIIGQINTRDLMSKSKFNDVRALISHDNYDLLAITESWLWPEITDNEISIDGYNTFRCDRSMCKKK
jgi:hypothetical protein